MVMPLSASQPAGGLAENNAGLFSVAEQQQMRGRMFLRCKEALQPRRITTTTLLC
jgi:hypothetical protein